MSILRMILILIGKRSVRLNSLQPAKVSMRAPCVLPPKGWKCSRCADHEGPCAATEV